jgi:hypothetical protein
MCKRCLKIAVLAPPLAICAASVVSTEVARQEHPRVSFNGASSPASGRANRAPVALARASFGFEDVKVLTATLVRSCKVLGA